jgi:hypothetical protein
VFVSIGGEMDSIAAGHLPEFRKSFANCRGSRDRSDTTCVHDFEITHTVTDQMFNQLVFEPDKAGHHNRLVFRVVGVGAMAAVVAAARKHMPWKGW